MEAKVQLTIFGERNGSKGLRVQTILGSLKKIVQVQSFQPSPILGILLNPFYFSRRSLDIAVKKQAPQLNGKILDIGCGSKPYRSYFPNSEYVGMEIGDSSERPEIIADVFYSGEAFPFSENKFDHAVSFQVLEHVKDPQLFIQEISRVLKKNGTVLLTVPFVWEEHEIPFDRTRYTSYGLRELFEKNGLSVVHFEKLSVGVKAIAQLFTGMVTVSVGTKPRIVRYLVQFLFTAPVHIFAGLIQFIFSNNDRFYLDNVILARKS